MKNILVISGHPDLSQSVASATILDEISRQLPAAQIRRLDSLYPTQAFDIAAEQQALLNADIIVWQFPFSWYSLPGLMKSWLDKVFLHGFSHGSTAKLAGKKLLLSFTTGGPQEVYSTEGFFKHTVDDYLTQFETTALLCQLDYQMPIYTTGISYANRDDQQKIDAQKALCIRHADKLIATLQQLAQ